jgi:hypothetical protein
VETPVAVGTVRGTAYDVVCTVDKACTFTVVEGTVEVTGGLGNTVPVHAMEKVLVDPTGVKDVKAVPQSEIDGDSWLKKNLDSDKTLPSTTTTIAKKPTTSDLKTADVNGDYQTQITYTAAAGIYDEAPGKVQRRTYDLSGDCTLQPCTIHLKVLETNLNMDLTGDGTSGYQGTTTITTDCLDAAGGVAAAGASSDTIQITIKVTDATLRDGRWLVTAWDGTVAETLTPSAAGSAAGCRAGSSSATLVGTRR